MFIILMGFNLLIGCLVELMLFPLNIELPTNHPPQPPNPHQKKKPEKKGTHKAYTFFPRRTCIYNLFTLMSHLMLCN